MTQRNTTTTLTTPDDAIDFDQFLPKATTRPTSRGLVHAAVADTFVRKSLQLVPGAVLQSRDLLNACKAWSDKQRLPEPSPHEVAQAMRAMQFTAAKSNGQRVWRDAAWVTEVDPWMTMGEPDALRRLTNRSPVFPLRVFIGLAGIGRSTFYAMAKRGDAPKHYRKGGRVFVLATDAMEWAMERENQRAVLAIAERAEDRWAEIDRTRKRAQRAVRFALL